ncbi:MAG TPA: TonB-dependent receptor [Oligoflexia bacterium]|nr:TonB-dependent receptor [Oligoflexia bacterium]HMP48874.1 TonB-dependent receptor [Oligoflexia bacterium]
MTKLNMEFTNLSLVSNFTLKSSSLILLFLSILLSSTLLFTSSSEVIADDMTISQLPVDEKNLENKKVENEKSNAEDSSSSTAQEKILQRIMVTGNQEKASRVPGSAFLLDGKELEQAKGGFDDIHRILRKVPGVNIQEEEGFGLRPNISFRGNPSERTDSITLMEDGVLIAPAPYSAPAAYYFPTAGRMQGIEVIKGAGTIQYGPRTTGGSLNLLSTSIPDKLSLNGTVGAGSYDLKKLHFNTGNSYQYGGWMLETYQVDTSGFKRLDGGGDTGYDLQDYVGKFRINTDKDLGLYQQLEMKLGYYNQDSNETYLGLTEQDFRSDPYRRYAASQVDNIGVDHYQIQARHYIEISDKLDVTTTAYYNKTSRSWYKLDSVGGQSLAAILADPIRFQEQYDWIAGSSSPDNVLSVRDNNRDYLSRGIQTVVSGNLETGPLEHDIKLGARFHKDEEDRFQSDDRYRMDNGTMVLTSTGAPGSQSNRINSAEAIAFYLVDDVSIGDFTLSPGLRYERINLKRQDFGRNDPSREGLDEKVNYNGIDALIPGIGLNYLLSEGLNTFAGVHKGFSPPGPTDLLGVREEESINYETGIKYGVNSFLSQFTFFYTDYDNLLGQDSLSSGGAGTGDLFNLGKARAYGIEASMEYDIAETFESSFGVPIFANYTYTNAKLRNSFSSDFFGEVSSGDRVPYIPDHQFAVGAALQHEKYGSLGIRTHFVNAMNTAGGTETLSGAPKTDSYMIFDASAESTDLYKGARLYVDALNLFDKEYAVALRPSGFRPGLPFTVVAGIRFAM